ncbi:MAG: RluA family pseudouridine synthase [Verrucomicrobiae bacterium]|nr:RluA family pseudouridine synthase [Verrucomicrobiae bacterium]
MTRRNWEVGPGEGGRLDQWLSQREDPALSRSAWQRLIREGAVQVNAERAEARRKLLPGDRVEAALPDARAAEIAAEAIPLGILYEDEDVVVVDKPAGLVVHPAAGHASGTLVNALLHHCAGSLSGIGGVERPGLVHRLDADTSGCLVVAKNDAAHHGLAAQFKDRTVVKTYLAWVVGKPRVRSGKIDAPIGRHPSNRKKMSVREDGRPALTEWKAKEAYAAASLLECRLHTGRTHQIRVHLSRLGHPIVGDEVYGGRRGAFPEVKRQLLHAWRLSFEHPRTQAPVSLEAPLPADFVEFAAAIRVASADQAPGASRR